MKELAMFAGPATGLWISGPLMSLIDTMVIGQASSIELAALGPGTVFCDYLSYIFMFLSISTSSMVATSLAKKMHRVLLPYFVALMITPATHSLEGTLLACRDLRFLSLSMIGCFCVGGLPVLLASSRGFGLPGCWWGLAIFQLGRFSMALQRLTIPHGMLYNEQFHQREHEKLKGA